jgi:transcriptional regulator with XRE-family HTH domain
MNRLKSTHIDDPAAFGARLRAARTEAGLSQRDLAFPGCSVTYISRIEKGERVPTLQVVRALAHRLGLSEDELATGAAAAPQHDVLLEAEVALLLGEGEHAEQLLTDALDALKSPADHARAYAGLAQLASRRGELDHAIRLGEEANRLLGDRRFGQPALVETLGRAYAQRNEYENAIAVLQNARDGAREHGDEVNEARFSILLANTLIDSGNFARAEELLASSLGRVTAATDPMALARLYWAQSRLHAARAEHPTAERYAWKALAAAELGEVAQSAVRAHHLLAHVKLERGQPQEALDLLHSGQSLVERGGDRLELALFRLEEARALIKLGRSVEGMELALDVAGVLAETSAVDAGRCYGLLAQVFKDAGEDEKAIDLYRLAIDTLADSGSSFLFTAYESLTELLEAHGRTSEALAVAREALRMQRSGTRNITEA